MIYKFLLTLTVLLQTSTLELSIGAIVPQELASEQSGQAMIAHSGLLAPSLSKKIDGVFYVIGYDSKSRKIFQITTGDENFQTGDGLRVGMYIEVNKEQLIPTGNGEVIGPKSQDGWWAVVGTGYQVEIKKDDVESLLTLHDRKAGRWKLTTAKNAIANLFTDTETLMLKIYGFTKAAGLDAQEQPNKSINRTRN